MTRTEVPLLLSLNPYAQGAVELPITIFEARLEMSGSEQQLQFQPVMYDIASEEAERIG